MPEQQNEPTGHGTHTVHMTSRKIPVFIGMPQELIDTLDAEATRLGLDSRAELVRQACNAFVGKRHAA